MTTLSRQQHRALERYARGVDLATASDRRWFEEHPHRRFRIRRMTAAEIGSTAAVCGLKPVPAGSARFTLVQRMGPNSRLRIFIFGPADKSGQETSEETAAALWQAYRDRTPAGRERELAVATIIADHEHAPGPTAA